MTLTFSLAKSNARKISARPYRFPKNISDLRDIWNEACAHISQHALQSAIKRAHSYDENHQANLDSSPWGLELDAWGNQFNSQPLEEVYASYPLNEDALDDEEDDFHNFWDELFVNMN